MDSCYITEQGDCLNSIALRYGHFWKTLWSHPENRELKDQRKNPDVLFAGDKVFVPQIRLGEKSGGTEQKHRFQKKGIPQRIRVQVKKDGEPMANEKYLLRVEDKSFSGKTDSEGWVDHPVSPEARSGTLTVGSGREALTFHLRLGHLDPVSEIRGLQARLKNLGYDCGEISGKMTEPTKDALRAFQREQGMEPSGDANEETWKALEKEHGS